jgi:geranylgeranyl diphosphate synthase, type II
VETVLQILGRRGEEVVAYLHAVVRRLARDAPPRLLEAIEYSIFAGGKRLRPALVLEVEVALSGRNSRSGLAAAGAIELIHTFSLVHDDLPAMDDDHLRRGQPTSHIKFDEATAILAGDAMTTLAFELIATDAEAAIAPRLVSELASAAGPGGMIGGQMLDILAEGKRLSLDELKDVHRRKTGALIVAACRMGAFAAGADEESVAAITQFARHLGLAFQIQDDILDCTATAEQTGKATGKDAAHGKNTYPNLMGLDEARSEASRQLDQALAQLEKLKRPAENLREIARFVVERTG